jgi:uncharacterized phage protein (TIGR01671 family)
MLNANSIIVDGLYIPFQSEVMQYTGIKDDDGTEICEGDIIRHYHKNRISESYETFIVKFGEYNNNMTYEDYVEGVGFYLYDIITGDVEIFCNHKVIGNIYENPELLGEYK